MLHRIYKFLHKFTPFSGHFHKNLRNLQRKVCLPPPLLTSLCRGAGVWVAWTICVGLSVKNGEATLGDPRAHRCRRWMEGIWQAGGRDRPSSSLRVVHAAPTVLAGAPYCPPVDFVTVSPHHHHHHHHRPVTPRVTFRRVVVSLRGPGQSPVLPFACCVGSLRSVGRCGRCSCWCRFRGRGAQSLVCRGCAECGGMCRLRVSGAQ